MKTNIKNRTLFTGDNLDVLRGINTASVDLIYLDPPFNSNRNYAAPIGSEAAGAAFKDSWTLDDVDLAWQGQIADTYPALYSIIEAAGLVHSKGLKAYLIMMSVRLIELRRVLKDDGSIYLHCDPSASHYLKGVMDSVFGRDLFKADISWKRTSAHNDKLFGSITDNILFYGGRNTYPDDVLVPLTGEQVGKSYNKTDERGVFCTSDLTGAGTTNGESGQEWGGYNPTDVGRHWSAPKTGKYAAWIEENIIPNYSSIKGVHARLDALNAAGLIYFPPKGNTPGLKRYLSSNKGCLPQNIWTDIPPVSPTAKEATKYPTQKPLALLERIIKASSKEGDVVLDPFCGCATACVAADRLNRQWIGIDLSERAVDLVRSRLSDDMGMFGDVTHRTDIPARTDVKKLPHYREHKHVLYGKQEGVCNGCQVHFPFRNMTVDHVVPQKKGGQDDADNLQLLCGSCNSTKGVGTQSDLIAKLIKTGILKG